MTTQHAPTPWKLGGASGRMITTPEGYVGDGFIADVDTRANAEFIVRAVNAHEALLEAVKLALQFIQFCKDTDIESSLEIRLKQAIAQAEGN